MRWVKATSVAILAIVSAALAAVGLEAADYFLDYRFVGSRSSAPWQTATYATVWVIAPVVAALFALWTLRAWWLWLVPAKVPPRAKHSMWCVLASGYLLTTWVGAPMAQTALTDMVLVERQREEAIDNSGVLPYRRVDPARGLWARTLLSVPVTPGIVVVYHEYLASGLNGRGAFYVFLWYGPKVKYLTSFQRWVS